jgi:hypothetical protein
VIAFNMCIAGSLLMQGIEMAADLGSGTPMPGSGAQIPPPYLFGLALAWMLLTFFVILRSPFRLTEHIDVLNEALNQQRQLRTSFTSDDGSEISLGDQLEEIDPGATIGGGVQRVTRVQWVA